MKKTIFLLLLIILFCVGCGTPPYEDATSAQGNSGSNEDKGVEVSTDDDVITNFSDDTDIIVSQKDSPNGGIAPDIQVKQKDDDDDEEISFRTIVIIQVNDESLIVTNMETPNNLYSIDLSKTNIKGEQGTEISREDLSPGQVARLTSTEELGEDTGSRELQLLGKTDEQILENGIALLEESKDK